MIIVADNLQITHPVIDKAVRESDPTPVRDLVRRCEAAGAQAIDINSGPLTKDPESRMTFLVETVQAVTDLPVFIDTANPKAMAAGLTANRKTAVINGFSLEPVKLAEILPLAKAYEVDIVGYLLYENGHVPAGADDRLGVAVAVFEAVQAAGVDPDRLIIDPIVAPVVWADGMAQNREILTVIRQLPELLGFPVRTMAGLSNLTTGGGPTDKKRLLERTYLPMLAAAGLSYALLNVFHDKTVRTAKACEVVMKEGVFSWGAVA